MLFFEWMVLSLCLLSAILLGILYIFFGVGLQTSHKKSLKLTFMTMEAFELVFADIYGFNLLQAGLTFLGIFVGMILGVLCDPLWRKFSCKSFVDRWRVRRQN